MQRKIKHEFIMMENLSLRRSPRLASNARSDRFCFDSVRF
jgi:hypothetical protein